MGGGWGLGDVAGDEGEGKLGWVFGCGAARRRAGLKSGLECVEGFISKRGHQLLIAFNIIVM